MADAAELKTYSQNVEVGQTDLASDQSINNTEISSGSYADTPKTDNRSEQLENKRVTWQDTLSGDKETDNYDGPSAEFTPEDYRSKAVTPRGYEKLEELKKQLGGIFDDLSTPIVKQVEQKGVIENQIEELEKDIQVEAKDRASLYDRNPEKYSKMTPDEWESCFESYKNDLNYLDDAVANEEMTRLEARNSIDMKYGERTEEIKIIDADRELKKFVDLMSNNDPDTNYTDYFAVYKKPDTGEIYIGKDDGGDSIKITRFDGDTISIPIDANFKTITITGTNIRNITELPKDLETMWLDDMNIEYLPILPEGLKKAVVKTSELSPQAKERLIRAMGTGCVVIGKDLHKSELSRISNIRNAA